MDKNSTSAIVVILIMNAVKSLGFTPPALINRDEKLCSLETMLVDYAADESLRIHNVGIDRLLIESRLLTGSTVLGFLAADGLQPAMLKAIGFSWLASKTLKEGIDRLAHFSALITDRITIETTFSGDAFCVLIHGHSPPPVDESIQFAAAVILRMCSLTANREIAPIRVYTKSDVISEKDKSHLKNYIDCEIVFNASCYQIDFNKDELVKPLISYCKEMTNELDEYLIKKLATYRSTPLSSKVINSILSFIGSEEITQKRIAEYLNMTPKNLQRNLSKENTNFSSLLRKARVKLATSYLENHHYSVKKTAFLLGYIDESSFTKAFKRWSGKSPTEFVRDRLAS